MKNSVQYLDWHQPWYWTSNWIDHSDTHTILAFSYIHCVNYKYYPFLNSKSPPSPPENIPGYMIRGFSKSTKAKYRGLCLPRCFSCNWHRMKIASVVPQPGIKWDCILSTWDLITESRIFFNDLHYLVFYFQASLMVSRESITFTLV